MWCVGVLGRGPGTRGRVHNIAAFLLPPLHTVYISISTSTHTSHRLHLYSVYTLLQAALQQTHDSPIHGLVLMFTINYVCLQTKHAAGGAEHVHCKLQYFLYYLNRVIIIIFTTTYNYVDKNMIDGALVHLLVYGLSPFKYISRTWTKVS